MNQNNKKIVIIGATSAIAEQCARLWVAEGDVEMILVGRDYARTELIACDLRIRAPSAVIKSIETDFLDPKQIQMLADDLNKSRPVDLVLIAHGSLPDQYECQKYLWECRNTLEVNGISPVLFAEAFASHMEKVDKGTLSIIGSVAGDRGRKSNYIYGAAKGLITRYVQGLQHRLAKTNIKVVLIKPGPTDTPMTAHLRQQGARLATAKTVAKCIVQGIGQGKLVIYAPAKWAFIMMVIRHIPCNIFKKMDI